MLHINFELQWILFYFFLFSATCKNVYDLIKGMDNGPVLWEYLKPLLWGKILYTPDTAVSRAIAEKVMHYNQLCHIIKTETVCHYFYYTLYFILYIISNIYIFYEVHWKKRFFISCYSFIQSLAFIFKLILLI